MAWPGGGDWILAGVWAAQRWVTRLLPARPPFLFVSAGVPTPNPGRVHGKGMLAKLYNHHWEF